MKYQAGDKLVVTEYTSLLITPYQQMAMAKGYVIVVIEAFDEFASYAVSCRGLELNIDAGKLESFTKLESMKDKRYKRVIESGLTYGQAMDKLILEGKLVTRKVWDGYWYKEDITYNGREERVNPYERTYTHAVIMAKLKTGGFAVASPYQEDMFATDWMIVE